MQMLVVQPIALLVGVIHLLTSSCSECGSGPNLQAGNQSCIDVGKTLPNDQEIPLPQICQDQRKPAQGPEPHVRAFGPRTDDVCDS